MDSHQIVQDRKETDESLEAERRKTDELLSERIEKPVDLLPEVSHKLERVADSLTKAAASLTGVADTLKDQTDAAPIEVVNSLAEAADELRDTAARAPALPDASTRLTEQLAEIAEGMADVTATIAEERRNADQGVHTERRVTDQLIDHEALDLVDTANDALTEEREELEEEREVTDARLAEERHHTDEAVGHVLAMLNTEQRAHATSARTFATRNEFLTIVSHDLRGPLMTIAGAASLIDQHAPRGEAGERIQAWVDHIRRATSVMERLVRDLLDFGSFEDGRLRVSASPHDLNAAIRHAADAFQAVAGAKSIGIATELPADPLMASFDPHRLHQVLSNLIHNAIKFTSEGGSIRLCAAHSGPECLVSVSDTGIGIPRHELASIFERFRKLDATDRTGLGLGLYISMWIVEAHGGRIWAESQPDKGSTFYFTLPCAP